MSTKIPMPGSWIKPVVGLSVLEYAKSEHFTEQMDEAVSSFAEFIQHGLNEGVVTGSLGYSMHPTESNGSILTVDDREHKQFVPKPYELRPHLTDKPFKNDPRLSELRDRMMKETKQ